MSHRSTAQLNIRSAFARDRVTEIARQTGMSVTQVVEDALRAYTPPQASGETLPPGLIRKGPILVLARRSDRVVTLEDTNDAIDAVRNRDLGS